MPSDVPAMDFPAELERIAREIAERASDDPRGLREPKDCAILRASASILRASMRSK